jgi:hypothetical protein
VSGLEDWLDEVDVFVCAEGAGIGDPEVLEAQLEQSNVSLKFNKSKELNVSLKNKTK